MLPECPQECFGEGFGQQSGQKLDFAQNITIYYVLTTSSQPQGPPMFIIMGSSMIAWATTESASETYLQKCSLSAPHSCQTAPRDPPKRSPNALNLTLGCHKICAGCLTMARWAGDAPTSPKKTAKRYLRRGNNPSKNQLNSSGRACTCKLQTKIPEYNRHKATPRICSPWPWRWSDALTDNHFVMCLLWLCLPRRNERS